MIARERIPESEWRWFGTAGHLIVGHWCRFHLCTQVGNYLVSTIGMYVHPCRSKGNEQDEAAWLKENPDGEQIGCDRFYETMVFHAGEPCKKDGCNCGMPIPSNFENLDCDGYQTVGDATAGHLLMCRRWAAKPSEVPA